MHVNDLEKAAKDAIRAHILATRGDGARRAKILAEQMADAMDAYARAAGLDDLAVAKLSGGWVEEIIADLDARTPTHRIDVRYVVPAEDGWQSSGRDMTPLMVKAADDQRVIGEAMGIAWEGRPGWEDARVTVTRLAPSGDGEVIFEWATPGMRLRSEAVAMRESLQRLP